MKCDTVIDYLTAPRQNIDLLQPSLTGYLSLYCLNEHNKHETATTVDADFKSICLPY